jgi:hypothetical protein
MTGVVWIIAVDGRNTLLRGPIREWLKAKGVPALWSTRRRGWWVRSERVADVVAQLERDRYVVRRSAK